jgi:pyrimidine operon attenuation protein/uracil phosphoribosyltransferase
MWPDVIALFEPGIDEVFSSGKTIKAMLHHLQQVGLPKDCSISVVVFLNIES